MKRCWVLALVGLLGAACGTPRPTILARPSSHPVLVTRSCSLDPSAPPILALTRAGSVVTVDSETLRVTGTLATGVAPHGGVAADPDLDWVFVTATGQDGVPAVWEVPLAACHQQPAIVLADAELPSLSPDGAYLGYVTLDRQARQTGVGILGVNSSGRPTGPTRRYRAASVPPPLPITGMAVAPGDAELAVWGGFVDGYLGPTRSTVGTLDPHSAASLSSAEAVFDGAGVSVGTGPGPSAVPRDWQSTPVFLPNAELLVGANDAGVIMPFTTTGGGGIRNIVSGAGPMVSLAAGPGGALAWVSAHGVLEVERAAVDLPFGPGAETPPPPPAANYSIHGHFDAVAWTGGAQMPTAAPPAFHPVAHLPDVVGMTQGAATQLLATLALPVLVEPAAPGSTAGGVVVAQDPPAGYGVACQCSVVLTVTGPPQR